MRTCTDRPAGRAALLIVNYDVHDDAALSRYRAQASHVILGATGRVLVSTMGTTHLPEAPARGSRTVVIRYASREEAERCYTSAAYQVLLQDRLAATTPHVALIVEEEEDVRVALPR